MAPAERMLPSSVMQSIAIEPDHDQELRKDECTVNSGDVELVQKLSLLGTVVPVSVVRTARAIEAWLQKISASDNEQEFGLDVEFRPSKKGQKNRPATLQLATKHGCLIVQLLYLDFIPGALVNLLEDENKQLAGVGVCMDCSMLLKEYKVLPSGMVELGHVAADLFQMPDMRRTGLAKLYTMIFQKPFNKDKNVTISDWTGQQLTKAQVKYAACDAWASYALLHRLNNVRSLSALPFFHADPDGRDSV